MESEASMFTGSALANYNHVLTQFGCGSSPAPLTCIQQVSAESILSYISAKSLSFAPANDNQTSTNDVRPSINSKRWANVPIFLGTNANEGRVFAAALNLDQPNVPITPQEVVANLLPNSTDAQNATLEIYSSLLNSTYLFTSQLITDLQFTCPTSLLSNYAATYGYDVWRYYYNATFPNESTFPNAGAYHSSEIPQVFGTYGTFGDATVSQEGLSAFMQQTWANFAKYPINGPDDAQGWPRLYGSEKQRQLWQLGGPGNPTGGQAIDLKVADYACPILNPIIAAGGL